MMRSIKKFKVQFIAAFLMSLLSVMVFSGLEGAWYGMKYEFDRFIDSSELSDEWVSALYFTQDDIDAIKCIKGVDELSLRTRITAMVENDANKTSYISLDSYNDNNEVSGVIVERGMAYDSGIEDALWLDSKYAECNGLDIGDSIEISYKETALELKIVGLVLSSEKTYYVGSQDFYSPDYEMFGYGLVGISVKEKLGIMYDGNMVDIKGWDSEVKNSVKDILQDRFISYYNRDTQPEISKMFNQIGNLKRLSVMFSVLFILLAILSINTTIKRLIDSQSSDVSVLKALGYSNGTLMWYFALYGLFISVLGTLAGYLLSFPFSNMIIKTQKAVFTLPEWSVKHTATVFVLIICIIILCVLTAFLASGKRLQGLPEEHKNENTKRNGRIFIERFASLWNKTDFGFRWSMRDAAGHKTRLIMGVISVCGSIMLLMASFGTPDAVTAMTNRAYDEEFTYSYKIKLEQGVTLDEAEKLQNEYEGQLMEIVPAYTYVNDEKDDAESYLVTVFSDGEYVSLKDTEGSPLDKEGIYVTEGIAEELELNVGDTVYLSPSLNNDYFKFTVAGFIHSSMPQSFYVSSNEWEKSDIGFMPSYLLAGEINDTDKLELDSRVSQIVTSSQQRNNLEDFKNVLNGVFSLMRVMAILLVMIVLYNLSTLSFMERTNVYNTFRVLGFRFSELRKLASLENILILITGMLIGIPAGFKFLSVYCNTFSTDSLKIYPDISGKSIIVVLLIVIICTLITTVMLSWKIRKIDMIEALKARRQ